MASSSRLSSNKRQNISSDCNFASGNATGHVSGAARATCARRDAKGSDEVDAAVAGPAAAAH